MPANLDQVGSRLLPPTLRSAPPSPRTNFCPCSYLLPRQPKPVSVTPLAHSCPRSPSFSKDPPLDSNPDRKRLVAKSTPLRFHAPPTPPPKPGAPSCSPPPCLGTPPTKNCRFSVLGSSEAWDPSHPSQRPVRPKPCAPTPPTPPLNPGPLLLQPSFPNQKLPFFCFRQFRPNANAQKVPSKAPRLGPPPTPPNPPRPPLLPLQTFTFVVWDPALTPYPPAPPAPPTSASVLQPSKPTQQAPNRDLLEPKFEPFRVRARTSGFEVRVSFQTATCMGLGR